MRFHRDMIKHITDDLSEDEAAVLIKTFTRLEDYLKAYHNIQNDYGIILTYNYTVAAA